MGDPAEVPGWLDHWATPMAAPDTFSQLIENSPFGVYIVDAELKLMLVSQGARQAFRNANPEVGRDFESVLRCVWPESRVQDVVKRFRHTLDSGEPYREPDAVERRLDTGELEFYDWKIERVTLSNGRHGVACQYYDLTEKRRTEEALRQLTERFRLALDAAGAFVYDWDPADSSAVSTYGMERVVGHQPGKERHAVDWWHSLIHPEDLPAYLQRLEMNLEKGGLSTSVYRVRHKNGAWIWVEATSQVVQDASGQSTKRVGAMVDITQRKEASDSLRESESRLRALHALSTRLLAAPDLSGALENLLDSAMEACGAHFGAVQLFNPQLQGLAIAAHRGLREPLLAHFQLVREDEDTVTARVLRSGKQLMIEDVELEPGLGAHRHIAAQAGYRAALSTPLKTHDAMVLGVLTLLFRRPHRASGSEQQLLELYARYAADLVVRLRYEQALRDAERHKDEFIATLAHELRGPLSPLVNSLAILKLAASSDERVATAHTVMDRQVAHLSRLFDDLLDINRIANHKLALRVEDVELAPVLRHVEEACRPLAERSGHALELDLPQEPIRVRGDPVRRAQIFNNLVTNACKYMERGGRISVRVRRAGDQAEVTVSDTGLGIPAELIPRIFDLFMQVDAHNAAGGLGLGLPLVKRLVEMHQGSVTAHSEGLGRGSCFVVRLPVASAAEKTPSPWE
jgi:PAS domain S-box-containing protein